jgi:hypothetical protein
MDCYFDNDAGLNQSAACHLSMSMKLKHGDLIQAIHWIVYKLIREENLLQMVLWKMVHFALFLVKISINFSPSYSTVFFPSQCTSLLYKNFKIFYYKNFKIFVQCFNE